ncbi:protein Asterix isoform X8 [Tenebrio molitor]|uniref:protein Asterix isoform X8 n=1 Tax=Tenebrio molitor TaxID=7067 RepID=UPI00362486AF
MVLVSVPGDCHTSLAGTLKAIFTFRSCKGVSGMIFSMCGLMMRLKWCAWVALYCSCISFANSRLSDDTKQILSSFMLSISAIVMSYLQNPQPMTPPWATSVN